MVKVKNFWLNGRNLLIRRQSSILSAALVIAITYSVSMILGIFRERLLVARFYSCCRQELDVYYAAFRLPDMIFQLVVIGALAAAFIPVFSEMLTKDEKKAYLLASSLINLLLVFFLVLALVIFVAAHPFSALITGNFTAWQVDLMAQMTRVMLLAQVFFLISNFLSAIVQSHQRFLLPALSPIVYNLGIILVVFFFSGPLGVWAATLGVLIGAFFHFLIQLPLAVKLGFRYSLTLDWRNQGVSRVLRLMLPRTLALAASQIEATVSLFLATSLSPGSLTIYYLAQRLADLPVRLLGTSIGQAALPLLSKQLAEEKIEEFKKTFNQSLSQILFIALPITAIFLVLRVQLVRFAYGAKTFPWTATIITGRTLAAITLSIFTQAAVQLLVRGFYALHDTANPFLVSLLSVVLNILLSLFFIFKLGWGIFGLALAFSLANLFNFLLLLLIFNWKKQKFFHWSDVINWLKMAFAAAGAGLVSWVSMRFLDMFIFETSRSLPLLVLTIISAVLGLFTYFLVARLFNFKELEVIWALGRKISHWQKTLFAMEEMIEPRPETATGI